MSAFRKVTTERLLLREPTLADLPTFVAIHADPETNRFNPYGPKAAEESKRLLTRWLEHWAQHGFGYWTASLKSAPDVVIGFGGVMWKDVEGKTSPNLYFRLTPAAWGRGLAQELGAAAILLALERWDEVIGLARRSNAPSRRALERLGMTVVRELDDPEGFEPTVLYCVRKLRS